LSGLLAYVALAWALNVSCRSNRTTKNVGVGFLFSGRPSIVIGGCQLSSVASSVNRAVLYFTEFSGSRDAPDYYTTHSASF